MRTKDTSQREQQRTRKRAPIPVGSLLRQPKTSLDCFKERQERKQLERAQALRKYKKVMKQEGYYQDRKQKSGENRTAQDDHTASMSGPSEKGLQKVKPGQGPRKAVGIFAKQLKKVEQRKKAVEDHEQREKERRGKLRERRQRAQLLTQRTRKGQPVMKNIVTDILHKLEKEQEESKQKGM